MSNDVEDRHKLPEEDLEADVKDYLRDKERIRQMLGKVGGVPQKKHRIVNNIFIILVAISFILGLVFGEGENLFLDIAILLVSLKLIYVVVQNMKVNHFQFWMLTTLEWRLNEITKDINKMRKSLDRDDK